MTENRYASAKEFVRAYGVSVTSLRHWASDGKIQYVLTPGGHHKYRVKDVEQILTNTTNITITKPLRYGVIYAREYLALNKNNLEILKDK
jgi:predicted site-specific integrase-resolvase